VIYELSPLDAPKWCSGFSENPMFMHLLEHPFVFRHQNQRIIQANALKLSKKGLLRDLSRQTPYRSWAIPCAGQRVYAPLHRGEWLFKVTEAGLAAGPRSTTSTTSNSPDCEPCRPPAAKFQSR
jgi:hypothetical protein